MEKFVLRDRSYVLDLVTWEAIGEHFAAMLSHQMGVLEASPDNKGSFNGINRDSH